MSDIQAATIQKTTSIYEERRWTVKEKLRDMIQRYCYEWGEWSEQAEGYKVVLFFSYSTEAMPEEIAYRLATAARTMTVTISAWATVTSVATTTMVLGVDRQPCEARFAVRWRRGAKNGKRISTTSSDHDIRGDGDCI